jgi:hypothetical protein
LNGHEWVEREARRKCLTTVKDGNCFVEGSDSAAVNRLAARLHQENAIGRLRELCERWIYSTCLCFALTHEEQKRSTFAYQYSVFQLELSRDLLFLRGTTMNEVYQKLIDRLQAGDPTAAQPAVDSVAGSLLLSNQHLPQTLRSGPYPRL